MLAFRFSGDGKFSSLLREALKTALGCERKATFITIKLRKKTSIKKTPGNYSPRQKPEAGNCRRADNLHQKCGSSVFGREGQSWSGKSLGGHEALLYHVTEETTMLH